MIEFVIVFPLLMLLVLGIIEFGVLAQHQHTLEQAAREGSRSAAVRHSTTQVNERILNCAAALPNPGEVQISLAYSTDNGQSFPYTLGDTAGGENDAPPGSLVEVTVTAPHHLITGSFFSAIFGAEGDAVPLRADVVMRRE